MPNPPVWIHSGCSVLQGLDAVRSLIWPERGGDAGGRLSFPPALLGVAFFSACLPTGCLELSKAAVCGT